MLIDFQNSLAATLAKKYKHPHSGSKGQWCRSGKIHGQFHPSRKHQTNGRRKTQRTDGRYIPWDLMIVLTNSIEIVRKWQSWW